MLLEHAHSACHTRRPNLTGAYTSSYTSSYTLSWTCLLPQVAMTVLQWYSGCVDSVLHLGRAASCVA